MQAPTRSEPVEGRGVGVKHSPYYAKRAQGPQWVSPGSLLDADSQVRPQTWWIRICIWKSSPRGFICTLKLKNHCTKPGSANFLLRAWYARLFSRLQFLSLLPPPPSSSSSSSFSFTSLQVEPTGLGLHHTTGLSSGRVVSGTETKVNRVEIPRAKCELPTCLNLSVTQRVHV